MIKNDIILVENREELKMLKELLLRFVTGKDYFDSIFNSEFDCVLFCQSWNIFNQDTFEKFIDLMLTLKEKTCYLSTRSFINYDIDKYLKFLKTGGRSGKDYTAVYKIDTSTSFESLDFIQEDSNYFIIDSYLIFKSGKICVYTNPSLDLMVIGFNKNLSSLVDKVYMEYSDRLNSIEEIFEYSKNAFSDTRKAKINLLANYEGLLL